MRLISTFSYNVVDSDSNNIDTKDVAPNIYNASQKYESTLLHKYVLNEFLPYDRSCTTKYF